jgi:16S rRNA (guanine527-N7)-methyltransferase
LSMIELAQQAQSLLGLRLKPAQLRALEQYEQMLIDWNSRINLTAIREPKEIRVKHFLDSLTAVLVLREMPPERLVDVGTGAGFPGIPIKIICPNMRLTLFESVGKKAEFCRQVVSALELDGVEVIQERAEAAGQMVGHREGYDWAAARAVASMPVLCEYLLPLLKVGGRMLAMKGESGPAEAHAAEKAMRLLGGRLRQLVPVDLPGVAEERFLVVVDKVAATHSQYPRRVGIPSKKPL